jgi:hypothetical protein
MLSIKLFYHQNVLINQIFIYYLEYNLCAYAEESHVSYIILKSLLVFLLFLSQYLPFSLHHFFNLNKILIFYHRMMSN